MTDKQMEKKILNELLDRYERSRLFREGASSQRILVNVAASEQFAGLQYEADTKQDFFEALKELRECGVVDFAWVRFERGNLVDRFWLVTTAEALETGYARAGRKPREKSLLRLEKQLEQAIACMQDSDLKEFTEELLAEVRVKRKIPRFLFDDKGNAAAAAQAERKNERLLLILSELSAGKDEEMERVLSSRLFGDSKYFEHELKSKTLSILRAIAKEAGEGEATDEELLAGRGLVRWPELLEFAGPVTLHLDDGSKACLDALRYGAGISSETVRHTVSLSGPVRQITSIENKANYVWYVADCRQEDELVLYHGGFYSPVKGRLFGLVAEAFPEVPVRHWSDIDLGGFRLYHRLKSKIFPRLLPYRMDLSTLEAFSDRAMPIESEGYRRELEKLLTEDDYAVFHEVIRLMLEKNLRLEQEALL